MKVVCLILVLLSSSLYSATTIRDPFAQPSEATTSSKRKQLVLEGIGTSDAGPYAVIAFGNDREIVYKGHSLNGYKLITIEQDYVVLVRDNKRKTLMLN